jgi:hypothetical protein
MDDVIGLNRSLRTRLVGAAIGAVVLAGLGLSLAEGKTGIRWR